MKEQEVLTEKRYTVREAARIIGVDCRTLRNYIEKGLIGFYRLGSTGKILIAESEIIRFLNESLQKMG